MYRALAELETEGAGSDLMERLIEAWMKEVSIKHKPRTQANDLYQTRTIKEAFMEFRAKCRGSIKTDTLIRSYPIHKERLNP